MEVNMKKIIVLTMFLSLMSAQVTEACGVFVSEMGTNIRANYTNVLLHWDENKKSETLVVEMEYLVNEGKVEDFGFIIPLPNNPLIDKAHPMLFHVLQEETKYKRTLYERTFKILFSNSPFGFLFTPMGGSDGVEQEKSSNDIIVHQEKKLGFYDVVVLEAKNKEMLKDWAVKNEYNIPWSSGEGLDHYIEKEWLFVLLKVRNAWGLQHGSLKPISFTFDSHEPVYPLLLSKYDRTGKENDRKTIPLQLYIVSDQKLEPKQKMYYQYGSKINKNMLNVLRHSIPISKHTYITKWENTFNSEHIQSDLTLKENDKLVDYNTGKMTVGETIKYFLLVSIGHLVSIMLIPFHILTTGFLGFSLSILAMILIVFSLKSKVKKHKFLYKLLKFSAIGQFYAAFIYLQYARPGFEVGVSLAIAIILAFIFFIISTVIWLQEKR
jgi:hypothetical protein